MNEDWKKKFGKLKKFKPIINLWPAALALILVAVMVPQTGPVLQEIPELLSETVLGATKDGGSDAKEDKKSEEEETAAGVGDYEDGEYEGSSNGYGGTIRVKVTVKDKQITAVDILEASGETDSFFSKAKGVIDKVLTAQTWEVDVVSGSTYSSRGILGAIQNALTGASVVNAEAEKTEAVGSLTSDSFEEPADGYADGTYTGSATGFGGSISVEVTIASGKISSINVTSAGGETASYLNSAKSVINTIISKQSPNVDTVSGATYSSNGIINAVKAALKKAAAAKSSSTTTESSSSTEETSTESSSSNKIYMLPLSQIKATPAETYADGIYAGVGTGYGGKGSITVKVQVSNGLIRQVQVVSAEQETPSYYEKAEKVINTILLKQSTDVDTVSGATFSSRGIIQAVKQALAQSLPSGGSGEASGSTDVMPAQALNDGVYTGTGEGFGGDVDVTITVSGGRIVTIAASGEDETANYFAAAEAILDNILKAQSADVDVASGATYSSNGIKEATRAAIAKAVKTEDSGNTDSDNSGEAADSGNAGDSKDSGNSGDNTDSGNTGDNKDSGSTADGGNTGDNTDSGNTDENTDGGNTGETTAVYKDGTAWGEVTCLSENFFEYQVKVSVVVENGVITNVSAERHDDISDEDMWEDNASYFAYAMNGRTVKGVTYTGVLDQIIQKQSADSIDVVSKSTYSSKSLQEAAQLALKELKNN